MVKDNKIKGLSIELLIILLLGLFSFMGGCQNKSAQSTHSSGKVTGKPVSGDWVVRNLGSDPQTLNPVTASEMNSFYVNSLLFDSLIDVDKDANFIPRIATSWDISPDNKVITFHLRKDVKFHDGVALTAGDVKYTFDKIMDPRSLAENKRGDFEFVSKVETPDKYTVKVTYKKPFAAALESWGIMIIPKHIYLKEDFLKSKYNRAPVGSGPYLFEKWDSNQVIILKANPDYWGGKPYLDKVVFKMIPDPTVSFNSLVKEDLDVEGIRPIQWVNMTNTPEFKKKLNKMKYFTRSYSYIGWNSNGTNPFFKDKKVRQAMTYAMNRRQILDKIFYGLGEICTGPFYPLSWAYDSTVQAYPFDLDKSRKLLDEAGWKDTNNDGIRDKKGIPFEFTFLYPSVSKTAEQMASIYQEDLKKIGVKMNTRKMEWVTFTDLIHKGDFQAYTMGWSLSIDPDPYAIWHSSQRKDGLNYVGFKNAEADKLMEEARSQFDIQERAKRYHRIHQIIHDEQPYTFLFFSPALVGVNKRLQSVEVSPQGLGLYQHYPGQLSWWVPAQAQKYRSK